MTKLTDTLNMLAELHFNLLDITRKKHRILISGEINPLLSVLYDESRLIKKIKEADKKTAKFLEQDYANHSLSEVIELQPEGDEKAKLTSIQNFLRNVMEEINRVNHSNQQLLDQSLKYTQYMIEHLVPISNSSGMYSAGASSNDYNNSRLFEAKA
jgi:flagellar biosynthesis/type III secretory pathway chaperone